VDTGQDSAAEIVLRLTREDCLLLQEAVDTEIYETEHQGSWTKRPHRMAQREARAERLHDLDRLIGDATGGGPLCS
jgi:hypothetical protein